MEAAVASAKKPKLLDRVRSDLRVKRYSIRTEKAYIDWIRRFILFHGKRHPSEMGEQKISAFLTHLAVDRNVAASNGPIARHVQCVCHDTLPEFISVSLGRIFPCDRRVSC